MGFLDARKTVNPAVGAGLSSCFQDVHHAGMLGDTDPGFKSGVRGEFPVLLMILARTELDEVAMAGYNEALFCGLLAHLFTDRIVGRAQPPVLHLVPARRF